MTIMYCSRVFGTFLVCKAYFCHSFSTGTSLPVRSLGTFLAHIRLFAGGP